jgi:hypothetical protein
MSIGADAMGVAAWLTPVLIVAVAAGLAHPAVGQPAVPARPASAVPVELIDPDCDPAEAEKADPLLVEEPDGVCPPDEPKGPGDVPPSEPDAAPGPRPGAPPVQPQLSPPPALEPPAALAPQPAAPKPRPAPGAQRRPAPAPDPARPQRRPADRSADSPARELGDDRRSGSRRTGDRRRAPEVRRRAGGQRRSAEVRRRAAGQRRSAEVRRRAAGQRRPRIQARRAPLGSRPPLAPITRGSLQALPEPLPPARRLQPGFARRLVRVADRFRVPWELMLAVRRARGHDGAVPATPERLRVLARRLVRLGARRNARRAVRRLARAIVIRVDRERPRTVRRRALVRRVVALAHLNRAVGRRGLVRGLKQVRARLARQILESRRLVIYAGGRHDIGSGLTDVRVLVLLRYLSSRYREVTVTSLTTGHSFFTASGNVSAHSFGRAVDIAALNGRPILGNQEPGGLTERALRSILLLPGNLEPSELISLFELGGPSFALADHADHIHVGY